MRCWKKLLFLCLSCRAVCCCLFVFARRDESTDRIVHHPCARIYAPEPQGGDGYGGGSGNGNGTADSRASSPTEGRGWGQPSPPAQSGQQHPVRTGVVWCVVWWVMHHGRLLLLPYFLTYLHAF